MEENEHIAETPPEAPETLPKEDKARDEAQFIQSLAENVLNGKPLFIIPSNKIKKVIAKIEEMKQVEVKVGNYKTAQQMENKICKLKEYKTKSDFRNYKTMQTNYIRTRKIELESQLENSKLHDDSIIQKFIKRKQEERNHIIQRHKEQMEKFEEDNQEMPAKFRKYSNDYLKLVEKERHLIRSKRYFEAGQTKIEREKQYKVEEANQKREWMRNLDIQRQKMEEAFQKQLQCHDEKTQVQLYDLQNASNQNVATLERSIVAQDNKLDIVEYDDLTPFTKKLPPIAKTPKPRINRITPQRMKRVRNISYRISRSERLTKTMPSPTGTPLR